ncbi:MAG: hypothetical protein JWM95_4080 [Gemmatimonadetes bacterium]|nr:hypothetical protein [Gemmatimonadota bacterium]
MSGIGACRRCMRRHNAPANLRANQTKCERSELPQIDRQVQRTLGGRRELSAYGGRDLGARGVPARIVVPVPLETHAIIAISSDDVELPMSHEIVSLASEIIFGDVRDAIGNARVDDRTADALRKVNRGRGDVRR